jgi:UDP-GlcNAc:undecaprenyl-phosphate GlcNAc-1-phosphate transferase
MALLFTIAAVLSLCASLMLVPVVRSLAHLCGVIDRPDKERKLHEVPVALGGGVAVFLSFGLTCFLTVSLDRQYFGQILGSIDSKWYVLIAASAAMLLVGLVDDIWNLRGRQKLLMQCLIVACLVGSGTMIEKVGLFGIEIPLGLLAYPVSILWLLIAVNALNLIDGADGVATTAGSIICLGFGFLSVISGEYINGVVGFALAGALVGFLAYNRPPASIYLGDAGSMMIGLLVGSLAAWSNVKESTAISAAPLAILAIPLFDSTAAIVRRWLTGRSIYATDRAHLHHLLKEKYGSTGMLVVIAAVCTATTVSAVLSVYLDQQWVAIFGVFVVLGLLIFTRSFGHAEANLVIGRATDLAHSLTTTPQRSHGHRHHRCVSLQGNGPWDTVWEPLVNFAESHEFARVKIDLNMAWLHEGYHANWQSVRMPDKAMRLLATVRAPRE